MKPDTDGLFPGELGPPLVLLMALDESRPLPEIPDRRPPRVIKRVTRYFDHTCALCGRAYESTERKQQYCGRSCASKASRTNLEGRD